MTTFIKSPRTNKITFYRNGEQVFDFTVTGNIYKFSNGDLIVI